MESRADALSLVEFGHFEEHLVKGLIVGYGDDVVRGKDDLGPPRERGLRDDVDRGGLQLDQEHVGFDIVELADERAAVGEIARDVYDVRAMSVAQMGGEGWASTGRSSAKVRDRTPPEVDRRARPESRPDDGDTWTHDTRDGVTDALPV